jgi:tetratricopeptide (TPR) repeat protein
VLGAQMLRASAYQTHGDFEESRSLLVETVEALKETAPDSSELGQAHWRLGVTLMRLKDYPESEANLRESIRIREKIRDARVSSSYSNLGSVLLAQGKVDEAIEWQGKAVQARRDSGALMSDFGTLLNNYAVSLTKGKRYEEAEAVFRESVAYDAKVRPGHPLNALNLRPFAEMLQLTGRSAEAEPLVREALQLQMKQPKADRVRTATVLAVVLDSVGKADEAAALRGEYEIPRPVKAP